MRALLAGALVLLAACTFVYDDDGEQRLGKGSGSSSSSSGGSGGSNGDTACFVGGCSSQLCTDQANLPSDCDWREEYACYRTATCERQADGTCGWTETPELRACLASH